MASFAFALIGDMPYGAVRETPFARLVAEVNRDNDIDFVMHAGDIKAGSERCDNELILHRFGLYQTFQRPFVYTPGDNEWTDCHRVNNGQYNPLERLAFLRTVFFPQIGQTTGGHVRDVRSQAEGGAYSEFVENVIFRKHHVMFATVHVVGSKTISSRGRGFLRRTVARRRVPIGLLNSNAARRPHWHGSTRCLLPQQARKACSY